MGMPSLHPADLGNDLGAETQIPVVLKNSEHPVDVDIVPYEHLIAQVQDIVNTNKVSLNFALANKVISSILVDLGSLENDLAAFPTNNSFDLLNTDKALVASILGPSSVPIVSDREKMAKWSPPPFPSFKIQFDGASKGNPRRSGVGVVIFDHSSKIIKVMGKHIGQGTNNVAEFQALSFGLDLSLSLNIKDIVIEGDSMVVFQAVVAKKCLSWHLQYFLDHILVQLKCFSTFSISHCFREINVIANFLANKAIIEGANFLEISPSDIPVFCMKLLS
ncbi:uncharacterized protein LOC131071253 [Cryptomeria japonica]|uniref:uncharacterized protein LOC131071253 n=1 Tax=Cryptomeria japonica TaxID=3369 RepID=UPI0027DA942F|nr:uncharacterized protein LOC131071253 [Cryptomeria japonica]